MSEYQYYDFRAIDYPLPKAVQQELRRHSTRAQITSTSFTNEYHYGSFKGDEQDWVDRYFDAFLYFANWGTRELAIKIPTSAFPKEYADAEYHDESFWFREVDTYTVLTYSCEEFDEREWIESEGLLPSLIGIRSEIMQGDYRPIYLGWLMSIVLFDETCDGEEEAPEPPVPAGLGTLSASQQELIEFFGLDIDLLAAAAEASAPLETPKVEPDAVAKWVQQLPLEERTDLLTRLISGQELNLRNELYLKATLPPGQPLAPATRTPRQLYERAKEIEEARVRAKAERDAADKAHREEKRRIYIAQLAGNEDRLWIKIEDLANQKNKASYDEAVSLIADLRDSYLGDGDMTFPDQLAAFQLRHKGKGNLMDRLKDASLIRR